MWSSYEILEVETLNFTVCDQTSKHPCFQHESSEVQYLYNPYLHIIPHIDHNQYYHFSYSSPQGGGWVP